MRTTVKLAVGLFAFFAVVGFLHVALGILRFEEIRPLLDGLVDRPVLLGTLVVLLLAIDSFLTIPTVATTVVAGYLLGPWAGGLCASIGILSAGSICFWGARFFGTTRFAVKQIVEDLHDTVGDVGPMPLLLSRAVPMLPEVMSALAGAGGLSPARYYVYFAFGNVPFAFAVAYSGSISTLTAPWPALLVGLGLPALAGFGLVVRAKMREQLI